MVIRPHRRQPLWLAYWLHRASGLALVLFLPFHFLVLGLALNEAAGLDAFLNWTANPLVKLAETGLVGLLGIHAFGGLRLLALELLPWSPKQKSLVALVLALSLASAAVFLLSAS